MSVACMSWVFAHSTAAGADRLLLLAIADHAGDDGGDAWPSVPTLARKTGTSERSVQRGIARLQAGGHLVIERCSGRGGTNLYRVVMAPAGGVSLSPPAPDPAAPQGCQPVTGDDLTPVTQPRHRRGDSQVSPERPRTSLTPQPPASGGRSTTHRAQPAANRRAAGTNPRAVQAAVDADRRGRKLDAQAAERAIRRSAIAGCRRCDAAGYVGGLVCTHDDAPARARAAWRWCGPSWRGAVADAVSGRRAAPRRRR
ncbi:helix-turn-helix domain-containing protein [Geodermatophilus sp. SYSU D01045]